MISAAGVPPARCVAVGRRGRRSPVRPDRWLLPIALAPGRRQPSTARWSGSAPAWRVVAAGWLWLVTTRGHRTAVAARARAGPPGRPGCRCAGAVLAACGVALPPAAWRSAAGTARATPAGSTRTGSARPAAVAGRPRRRPTGPRARRPHPGVVVAPRRQPLWAIAGRDARAAAPTTRRSPRCWRELYDLNRAAIGPDPDLIRPAQRLRGTALTASRPPRRRRRCAPGPDRQRAGHPRPRPPAAPRPAAGSAPAHRAGRSPTCSPIDGRCAGLIEQWARRYAQAAVEIVGGDRPVTQLLRWSSREVYDEPRAARPAGRPRRPAPARAGPGPAGAAPGARRPHLLRRPATSSRSACTCGTASAPVPRRPLRARADQRWCCTALEFA